MCGFLGTISKQEINIDRTKISNKHTICRGPDSKKEIFSNTREYNDLENSYNFHFLFNRLSILDLSDLADVYYDILVFFSPSGIESLFHNFPDFKQNDTRIAVFGNTTVKAVENKGLRVDIAAPTKDTPSMSMALERYIKKMNKK